MNSKHQNGQLNKSEQQICTTPLYQCKLFKKKKDNNKTLKRTLQ